MPTRPPAARRPAARGAAARHAGPPPRQRLDLEVRREQLLSAAFELFAHRSYDEVGIEDVARAAGASKGLLYHYFPTKKDLYRAAVQRGADLLLERTTTPDRTPPLERLELGLRAYFAYVEEHADAYGALMRSGVGVDPEIAAVVESTRDIVALRLLEGLPVSGVDQGPAVRAAVRGWIGFVEAIALRWIADRQPDLDALRNLAAPVLLAALTSAAGAPRA